MAEDHVSTKIEYSYVPQPAVIAPTKAALARSLNWALMSGEMLVDIKKI